MTKDESVDANKHAFEGMLLDSWVTLKTGAQAMDFVRKVCPQVERLLGQVFEDGFRAAQEDAARFQGSTGKTASELFGDGDKPANKKGSKPDGK